MQLLIAVMLDNDDIASVPAYVVTLVYIIQRQHTYIYTLSSYLTVNEVNGLEHDIGVVINEVIKLLGAYNKSTQ